MYLLTRAARGNWESTARCHNYGTPVVGAMADEISRVHMAEVQSQVQSLVDMQDEYERLTIKNNRQESKLNAEGKVSIANNNNKSLKRCAPLLANLLVNQPHLVLTNCTRFSSYAGATFAARRETYRSKTTVVYP
eukprot:SAG31_NODE_10446_length_1137_cov_1.316956_2_plen_135_part_00